MTRYSAIVTFTLLVILAGCDSVQNPSNRDNISPGTTATPTPGANVVPTATPDPNAQTEAYRFSGIIAHGNSGGAVQWSSATVSKLASSQSLFVTDTRLKLRVKARSSPGKVAADSYGNACTQYALPYKKLQVTVGVRRGSTSTYLDSYIFDDIAVGTKLEVQSFTVPPNSLTEPFVVEIHSVKWDYTCEVWYDGSNPNFCPWDYVWPLDCFELELEMATDYTADM